MLTNVKNWIAPLCLFFGAFSPAFAEEPSSSRFGAGDLVVSASVDYLNLRGDFQVYYGPNDSRLFSRQDWKTNSAMGLTGKLRFGATERMSLYAEGTFGFLANNHATTTSWAARGAPFFFDDWTDQSQHSGTMLDHYYNLDLGTQFTVLENQNSSLGLLGGFRYTDVQWTAAGGSGISSDPTIACAPIPECLLRNVFTLYPDGDRLITNQQQLPAVYTGFAAEIENGSWSMDGAIKLGATIGAQDTNQYWLPGRKFESTFNSALYLGLSANVAYKVKDNIKINLGVSYDHFGLAKGNLAAYSMATGDLLSTSANSVGTALEALKLSLGASAKF